MTLSFPTRRSSDLPARRHPAAHIRGAARNAVRLRPRPLQQHRTGRRPARISGAAGCVDRRQQQRAEPARRDRTPDERAAGARHPLIAGTEMNTRLNITAAAVLAAIRSEEHTSELKSLMRISYAVFCLKKKIKPSHHDK